MDHIPRPSGSASPVNVPFLAQIDFKYDFLGFDGFHRRHGFATNSGRVDLNRDSDSLCTLMQTWLYFGLISEVLGYPVPCKDFLKRGEGFLDSSLLEGLVEKRVSYLAGVDPEAAKTSVHIFGTIQRAKSWCSIFDNSLSTPKSPYPEVVLSVKVLISTLEHSFSGYRGRSVLFSDPLVERSSLDLVTSHSGRLLRDRLVDNGFCPALVRYLLTSFDCVTVYYISLLRRRKSPGLDHRDCSENTCVANNVSLDHYRTAHVEKHCTCAFSPAMDDVIESIISKGGIPLISITSNNTTTPDIHVSEATATSPYVAFSHVWSDGLGNPKANSLPRCQLERLAGIVNEIGESGGTTAKGRPESWPKFVGGDFLLANLSRRDAHNEKRWFWIDTLCIPVGNTELKRELKRKAINHMSPIYAGASRVVVLDSEIEQLQLKHSDHIQILAELACSAWMRRCWTFQEGALSRDCYLQCADGTVNPFAAVSGDPYDSERHSTLRSVGCAHAVLTPQPSMTYFRRMTKSCSMAFALALEILKKSITSKPSSDRFFQDMMWNIIFWQLDDWACRQLLSKWKRTDAPLDGDLSRHFWAGSLTDIWNTLSFRASTRIEDIHAIFANLLDFNSYQILSLPSMEERMEAMVLSLHSLPLSLLYVKGPRVRSSVNPRNKWIPVLPTQSHLTLQPLMKRAIDGYIISSDYSRSLRNRPTVLILDHPFRATKSQVIIVVDSSKNRWEIRMCHDQDGDLSDSESQVCILIEPLSIDDEHRGALLQISPSGQYTEVVERDSLPSTEYLGGRSPILRVRGNYVGPLQIRRIFLPLPEDSLLGRGSNRSATYPVLTGTVLKNWELVLEYEAVGRMGPYLQRPRRSIYFIDFLLFGHCWLFSPMFHISAIAGRAIHLYKSGDTQKIQSLLLWVSMGPIPKLPSVSSRLLASSIVDHVHPDFPRLWASPTCYALAYIPPFLPFYSNMVLSICDAVSPVIMMKERTFGEKDIIYNVVFLATSICGWIFMACWSRLWVPYVRQEWLNTFKEEWRPGYLNRLWYRANSACTAIASMSSIIRGLADRSRVVGAPSSS